MTALTPVAKQVRPLVGSTVVKAIAGGTSAVGHIVRWSSDDTVVDAASDTSGHALGQVGMIVAGGRHTADGSIVSGETLDVLILGRVFIGNSVTLDFTKQYFLSPAGGMADAAGTVSRLLALPLGNGVLNFTPVPIGT